VRRGRLSIPETPERVGHAYSTPRDPMRAREPLIFPNYFGALFPTYSLACDYLYESTVRSNERPLMGAVTDKAMGTRREARTRKEAYA
jgi:hypothetical protein